MKRWMALAIAVWMALSMAAACAESVSPSITIGDLPRTRQIVSFLGEDIQVQVVFAFAVEEDTKVAAEARKIAEFLAAGQKPLDYFDEETKELILEKLPEETDEETLEINEVIALSTTDYDPFFGDIDVIIEFITKYEQDENLVAVVGTYPEEEDVDAQTTEDATDPAAEEEEGPVWSVLNALVEEDGKVRITFTRDIFDLMEHASETCLVIIND